MPQPIRFSSSTFKRTPDMIRRFGELTGVKYPWNKYAHTATVPDFAVRNGLDTATLVERIGPTCRANLGDARCTVSMGGFTVTGNGLALDAGIRSTGDNAWAVPSTLSAGQAFASRSGTLSLTSAGVKSASGSGGVSACW